MDRKDIARQGLLKAIEVRRNSKIAILDPICIYDLAEEHSIEVRFEKISSMEGMYCRDPGPIIIITSERPVGRQAFTCAHEFAHHLFGHETSVDELDKDETLYDPKEFLADCFAGYLLMPQTGIGHAFTSRGWSPKRPTAIQVYTVAGYFGVGYQTLVKHMNISLRFFSHSFAKSLLKHTPKDIRRNFLSKEFQNNLYIVDSNWNGRPVDIQIGDIICAPKEIQVEAYCLKNIAETENNVLYEGITPGIGRLFDENCEWSIFTRVSRRSYVGRKKYIHLEEADDE